MGRIAAVEARKRRAVRLLVRACLNRESVSPAELDAVAVWLRDAARGAEQRPWNLRQEMTKRGLTTVTLGRLMGVQDRSIRRWLAGERRMSMRMAARVAVAFGLPASKVIISTRKREDA